MVDVPALPRHFISEPRVNQFLDALEKIEAQPFTRYQTSLSRDIRRVPLQVGGAEDRAGRKALFMPSDLIKQNIGSNIGFINIMEDLVLEMKMKPIYQPLLSDINIYNRCLKVNICICHGSV